MSELKRKLEEINYFEDSEKTVEVLENLRELLGAIFIQEQRNYDMLMIIADKLGADANKLLQMHELGEVLAPAPSFKFEDSDASA
jgi:hypothetical protein